MTAKTPGTGPKFPTAHVQLTGHDGNVFAVLGRMIQALRAAGATDTDIAEFTAEARSGDYDNALRTCMKWADVS